MQSLRAYGFHELMQIPQVWLFDEHWDNANCGCYHAGQRGQDFDHSRIMRKTKGAKNLTRKQTNSRAEDFKQAVYGASSATRLYGLS